MTQIIRSSWFTRDVIYQWLEIFSFSDFFIDWSTVRAMLVCRKLCDKFDFIELLPSMRNQLLAWSSSIQRQSSMSIVRMPISSKNISKWRRTEWLKICYSRYVTYNIAHLTWGFIFWSVKINCNFRIKEATTCA